MNATLIAMMPTMMKSDLRAIRDNQDFPENVRMAARMEILNRIIANG